MNEPHYLRVTTVFHQLVDCPEGERQGLLAELSLQEPEVHKDVASLLAFDQPPDEESDLLSDQNIVSPAGTLEELFAQYQAGALEEPRPDRVGPYSVLRELGRGGMGTVYLCHQQAPLRRNLAVKVIRRGMDTQEVVRRFDFEREAIARMDHAGIARVLDAGSTREGLPYIAMEYVQGVPLTEFCVQQACSLEVRLRLFVRILRALEHAHQRGVIHRDLKPSNVLVDSVNGVPVPKIIDFGLARALDTEPSEATTRIGQLLGTPAYMSPEQFASNSSALDVRTDVYSAGVMLFELLCGELPYPAEPGAGPLEVWKLRSDLQAAVPRPSDRFGTDDADARRRAANRQSSSARLRRTLRGDLDWITRTALDPSPDQRYSGIETFAADIEAFLGQRPVSAGPPHWRYRSARYVRRNRGMLSTVGFVILGFCAAITVLLHSNRRALAAESNARDLLTDVESQNVVLNRMLQVADPRRMGPDARVTDMLAHGADHVVENYRDRPRVLAGLLKSIGGIYRELGDWGEAERCLQLGLANQRQVPDSDPVNLAEHHNGLALLYTRMGRFDRAEEHYRGAIQLVEDSSDPKLLGDLAAWEYNLGSMLWKIDSVDAAEEMLLRSLAGHQRYRPKETVGIAVIQGRLGEIALVRGDVDRGLELLRKSLDLAVAIRRPGHPQVCSAQLNLGRALLGVSDRALEGRDQLREALESARVGYGEGSRSLITYLCPLADAERTTGDFATSDSLLLEAEELLEPSDGPATLADAKVWMGRSRWLIDCGRASEATGRLERVLEIYSNAYEPGHSYRNAVEDLLAQARSD